MPRPRRPRLRLQIVIGRHIHLRRRLTEVRGGARRARRERGLDVARGRDLRLEREAAELEVLAPPARVGACLAAAPDDEEGGGEEGEGGEGANLGLAARAERASERVLGGM